MSYCVLRATPNVTSNGQKLGGLENCRRYLSWHGPMHVHVALTPGFIGEFNLLLG